MNKLMLFMIAVMSSGAKFAIINMLILNVTIIQYILIEVLITASHWFYNKAKSHAQTSIK